MVVKLAMYLDRCDNGTDVHDEMRRRLSGGVPRWLDRLFRDLVLSCIALMASVEC